MVHSLVSNLLFELLPSLRPVSDRAKRRKIKLGQLKLHQIPFLWAPFLQWPSPKDQLITEIFHIKDLNGNPKLF